MKLPSYCRQDWGRRCRAHTHTHTHTHSHTHIHVGRHTPIKLPCIYYHSPLRPERPPFSLCWAMHLLLFPSIFSFICSSPACLSALSKLRNEAGDVQTNVWKYHCHCRNEPAVSWQTQKQLHCKRCDAERQRTVGNGGSNIKGPVCTI